MIATEYPEVSRDPAIQAAYEQMRRNGQSHNMAEMLAFRRLPGAKTDTRFSARLNRGKRYPASYYAKARAAGVTVHDKAYISQLAEYPGDPRAWVGGDARSEIIRRCRQNGYGCEGAIEIQAPTPEIPDDKPYRVADDIVRKTAAKMTALDPGLVATPERKERLLEETRERLTGNGPW